MDFLTQRYLTYDHISAEKAMAKRNRSKAGDLVKGVKVKYQLAIMKEPPLRVTVGIDAYKVIMAKIKAYGEIIGGLRGRVIVLMLRDIRLLEITELYMFE